jgi:hypothetical protein
MRDRLFVLGGVILVVIVILAAAFAAYQGLQWYQAQYGDTPEKAVRAYFQAMGQGNFDTMYEMTPSAALTDLFGREISRDDFAGQVRKVLGGQQLTIDEMTIVQIGQRGDTFYYRVTLRYTLGGAAKVRGLLIEVTREGTRWKITYPFTPNL